MTRTPRPSTPARVRAVRLLRAAVVLAACGAGGCVGVGQPAADGIPVRRLPAEVFGRPRCDLQPVPLTLLRQTEPAAYRVDKGDVLTVFAEDVLGVRGGPAGADEPRPGPGDKPAAQGYPLTVQDDGTILIPDVPPVQVRGLTLPEVRAAVVKAITVDKKLIVPGKERVTVDLLKKRQYRVLVVREDRPAGCTETCDAKTGGFTLLLDAYRNDLLEALNRTGGLPGPAARPGVVIRRGGYDPAEPARGAVCVPVRTCPGDPLPFTEADVVLTDGDTVLVQARGPESYAVVGGPGCGRHPLPPDADLRVIEALAKATCPTPDCGWVTVLRRVGCARQVPIKVDLAEALRDPRENILIQPGDVIVLPGCGHGKGDGCCTGGGCGLAGCGPKRSWLPGWFSPVGPHHWPVTRGEACGVCP